MDWSFQLYSARKFEPWSDVLAMLAAAGYRQVEGFGGVYDDPAALRALMDRHGLSMPSGHFSIDILEQDFAAARGIATTLGVSTIVCPYLMPDMRSSDAEGWRAFGARLEAVGHACRDAGFGFAWHNHDFEFRPLGDGSVPQDLIAEAAPGIGFELDIAWVVRGGADPLAWIDRHGDRIVAVHVKDIAPQGVATDEDGWADVGHGTVPWPAIMAALRGKTPATVFVMEHDNPSDVRRFAERSIATVRAL